MTALVYLFTQIDPNKVKYTYTPKKKTELILNNSLFITNRVYLLEKHYRIT